LPALAARASPAGAEIPMPYAPNLEAMCLPQIDDIVKAAKVVLNK
jgi:hypothetical protein